ncbi:unnamed protein product [Auanema sp. JU1783]|nr:unnamed protein product [Auanema sp. JU1783]
MEAKTPRSTKNYNDLEVFLGMVDSLEPTLKNPFEEAIKAMASGHNNEKEKKRRRPRRANRMKVYDNGYIFTYDKDSQCGQRSFWRCERKTECPARVHTNPLTNQIIKRINSHTHEPSILDELPPWLLVSEDASTSTSDPTVQTGVILPQYSSSLGVSSSIFLEENTLEVQDSTSSETCTVMKDEIGDTILFSPNNKKLRRDQSLEMSEKTYLETEDPEAFWNIFNMTKRIIRMIRNDRSDGFMANQHFPVLGDSILSASCSPTSSSNVLTVYIAPADMHEEDPVYQMISLYDKTQQELRSLVEKRGLIKSSEIDTICINGPNGINVELTDEIIRSWPQDAIFQFSICKRVCKIKRMMD